MARATEAIWIPVGPQRGRPAYLAMNLRSVPAGTLAALKPCRSNNGILRDGGSLAILWPEVVISSQVFLQEHLGKSRLELSIENASREKQIPPIKPA